METKTFGVNNYIQVPGFAIVNLGLSGNELLCFSLIYGFSQDNETEFRGSLNYVASALNVTKQNAKKIIDRLIDRGLIEKHEVFYSGVKFCHYVANVNGVTKTATGCYQNSNGVLLKQQRGVAKTATHIDNTKDKTNIYNYRDNIESENEIFAPAKVESDPFSSRQKNKEKESCAKEKEVRPEIIVTTPGRRKTSEGLCLFENSKYYDRIDEIKEQFTDEKYSGVDIDYYIEAVSDWSARKGVKRRDWIAEIRSFIRKDVEAKKVHKVQDFMAGLPQDAIDYLKMGGDI